MLRPNYAMDAPPTEIIVGGAAYPAKTDYRIWLHVLELLRQWRSAPRDDEQRHDNAEILGSIECAVFGGILADESAEDVLAAVSTFLAGYPTAPMEPDPAETPGYSFSWDINEIVIAIRNQAGKDLSWRCEHFHWWEFLLEFRTLCGEHYFLRLMETRTYDGKDPDLLKRKRRCALPVEHTADERAALDEINALFSGAV